DPDINPPGLDASRTVASMPTTSEGPMTLTQSPDITTQEDDAPKRVTSDDSIFSQIESEVRSYCRNWTATFERAQRSHVFAEDVRRYLDSFSGACALIYVHTHPGLLAPLVEYLTTGGVVHSLDMHTTAKRDFLATFQKLILEPRGFDHKVMFPGPTGTNTV